MSGKHAKILSLGDVNDLLAFACCTRHPLRNRVIVLLAAKAGLRAVEIAQLTWDMVIDPTGHIGNAVGSMQLIRDALNPAFATERIVQREQLGNICYARADSHY